SLLLFSNLHLPLPDPHFFPTRRSSDLTARELQILTRGNVPPLGNSEIPRAVMVHRPEIAESHAQESSIARESRNLTRGSSPPLGKCRIPRAGAFHRSGIAESHAQESSIAQES